MKDYHSRYPIILIFSVLLCLLVTACGQTYTVGGTTTPTPTPTPSATASVSTPTPTTQASSTNTTFTGLGKDYAFVRNYQVWLGLNGADPVQATHFTSADGYFSSDTNWSRLYWFDNDRYVAFLLDASRGRGGNYCMPWSTIGLLYVIDTSTMQTTRVTFPNTMGSVEALSPQDATHLLVFQPVNGGIYQYDLVSGTASLLLPMGSLAPTFESSYEIYTMAVQNGLLYYETATPHDATDTSHFIIYSQAFTGTNSMPTKIFDAGANTLCSFKHQSGPFTNLGWSLSPDGTHLAVQTIDNSDPLHPQGHFELVSLQGGASTPIFTQVPTALSNRPDALEWSPNSQNILLTTYQAVYTSTLADPATTQTYQTQNSVNANWLPDGAHFTLENRTANQIQVFSLGTPTGQTLLSNATYYSHGNQ
jgi:hypothetical protein